MLSGTSLKGWLWGHISVALRFLLALLPSPLWLLSYNWSCILEDIVAGIALSLVATGISSLLTADITYRTFDKVGLGFYTPEQVAQLLAVLSGLILAMLGVLRLGWLLRCIPKAATDAYATAVSVKLIITQLPVLLGIVGVSNEGSPFVILANVLRYLSESNVDIAFGIPSIVFLGCVAYACEFMTRRYPGQQRFWNLISTLRFPVVIALSILCSWLVYRGHYGGPIQTVGEIDPGFLRAHLPMVPSLDEFKDLWTELPAIVLMMAVSQAALVQRLATSNGYTVNNSRELIALGVVNIFGPCARGYLTMGSFSSSTILSMAGSRSQLAGVFAALMYKEESPDVPAIIFDFKEIDHIDLESARGLGRLRLTLDANTECYFANVKHFWMRRTLVEAGFDSDKIYECVQDAVDAAIKSA
ncbi:hypothetical protein ACHAO4_003100 [Trichoderma viride]